VATKFTDPTSLQLNKTLARRFIPLADKLRDLMTKFGLRPYKVRIMRVKWSSGQRGVGVPSIVQEIHILPTPLISDLTSLQEIVHPVGLDEMGSIQLSEVSGTFTEDDLMGRGSDGESIPSDDEVFFEIEFPRPDGKASTRRRFYMTSPPHYHAGRLQWIIRLERAHEDRDRSGDPE
jgi:hypothetical protein